MNSILFTILLAVGGAWASALPLDYGCDVTEENEVISKKSTTELACESYVNQSINGRSKYAVRRIFSGRLSRRNEFPHMVALGYWRSEDSITGSGIEYRCGGVIISERHIITAAHCVTSRTIPIFVRVGTTNIESCDERQMKSISRIIVHPTFNPMSSRDDIALIELTDRIEFTQDAFPACLHTNVSDLENGSSLWVSGWGVTQFESKSNILLSTNLTSMPLDECNETLSDLNERRHMNNPKLNHGLHAGQICAFDPFDGGHDTCEGDSGGGLEIRNFHGVSTLVGITSFGIGCGSSYPGVYTRVAFYVDWIEDSIWNDQSQALS